MDTLERLLLESKKRLSTLIKKYHCMAGEEKFSECDAIVREIGIVERGIKRLKEEINHG